MVGETLESERLGVFTVEEKRWELVGMSRGSELKRCWPRWEIDGCDHDGRIVLAGTYSQRQVHATRRKRRRKRDFCTVRMFKLKAGRNGYEWSELHLNLPKGIDIFKALRFPPMY